MSTSGGAEPAASAAPGATRPEASAVLWSDGGARGNPGPAGAAFVLESESGVPMARAGRFLGDTTNNVAEYEALIWGLDTAQRLGVRDIVVHCDSELVVRQLNGIYRVKHENMKPLFLRAQTLLRTFESSEVRHVRRERNTAADQLVNEAIDARASVGDALEPPVEAVQGTLFDQEREAGV